jgi:hypothetical protein
MVIDEHQKRQVAVLVVLREEAAPLLFSVKWNGIGIDIDGDAPRRTSLRSKVLIYKKCSCSLGVQVDPTSAPSSALEPVYRRARGKRLFAPEKRKHWIMPQAIVIVNVLVSSAQRKHPLPHHRLKRMSDLAGLPLVDEAAFNKPIDDLLLALQLSQQQ